MNPRTGEIVDLTIAPADHIRLTAGEARKLKRLPARERPAALKTMRRAKKAKAKTT